MLNISNKYEAENVILKGEQEFSMVVHPNFINKFSLYLTGRVHKGVEIIGIGPMAMRAYWSLLSYAKIVGLAIENKYRVFIKKDGAIFQEGCWYIEFRK